MHPWALALDPSGTIWGWIKNLPNWDCKHQYHFLSVAVPSPLGTFLPPTLAALDSPQVASHCLCQRCLVTVRGHDYLTEVFLLDVITSMEEQQHRENYTKSQQPSMNLLTEEKNCWYDHEFFVSLSGIFVMSLKPSLGVHPQNGRGFPPSDIIFLWQFLEPVR